MSRANHSLLIAKSKLPDEMILEDRPEAKFSNSKRKYLGVRVNNEPMEDVFSRMPAEVYLQRQRPTAHTSSQPPTQEKRSSSLGIQNDHTHTPKSPDRSKFKTSYQKWIKSDVKEFPTGVNLSFYLEERHFQDVIDAPEDTRAHVHLQNMNTALQLCLKNHLESDHTIDANDRSAIYDTGANFLDKLTADSIAADIELHNQKSAAELKRPHPLTVFQRNRRKVIEDVTCMVKGIEESMAEAQKTLLTDIWPEFDNKLDNTLTAIRVIQDTRDLDAEIQGITNKHNRAIENEFDPVIRGAFRNDQKQMELFKKLSIADQMLVQAEEQISKNLSKTITNTVNSNSIELVSKFLSLN